MRVYEFSKQHGLTSKDVLKMLQVGGFDIQNHMSVLTEENLKFLQDQLKKNDIKESVSSTEVKKEEKKAVEVEQKSVVVSQQTKSEHKVKPQMESTPSLNKSPNKILDTKKIELDKEEKVLKQDQPVVITLKPTMLGDLADKLSKPATEIIITLLKKGLAYNKNQVLPEELVEQIATSYGFVVAKEQKASEVVQGQKIQETKNLTTRLPVVVVIGHVDHGKTTLLDFIRKTRVAAKEKGGITQHLGAYEVKTSHGGMIFLDTPGHEAFSMMRGRGVRVADIAILMVAADDGVMPQTVEAIKLAKAKNIPVIVALNKVDKVDATRIEQVKGQLSKHDLVAEDWGGQAVVVPISAKSGQGVDQLLEMILLQSELMDLQADSSIDACGYVLESKFEKGLGPVATFIAQHGTIKVGDYFLCGETLGKVTVLVDSHGKRVQSAGPSIPVQISGFEELPQVGSYFQVVAESEYRKAKSGKLEVVKSSSDIHSIPKEAINIIVKTDNNSSKEALLNTLKQISKKDEKQVFVVSSGVGSINENDVNLAVSSKAIIYGFNVKPEVGAGLLAQKNFVSIKLFDIIYRLLDDIKDVIKSKKQIELKRVKVGEGIVRKVFDIKGIGVIAGFYVKEGKILKTGRIVVTRGNKKIGEGEIKTLQRDKKSMQEVASGFEGALLIQGYKDWLVDDKFECYIDVPV